MAVAEIISAIAWPIVVGSSLFYFRKQVQSVLSAFETRLKSGASMKFGSLEIGPITPQSAKEVEATINEEVKLALEADEAPTSSAIATKTQPEASEALASEKANEESLHKRIPLAERGALRKIRDNYNTPINEMIKIGDLRYDGFFARDGRAFIIETKYHRVGTNAVILAKNLSDFLITSEFRLRKLGWKNYHYILAIVLDGIDGDVSLIQFFEKKLRDTLAKSIGDAIDRVEILVFDFDQISAEAKD